MLGTSEGSGTNDRQLSATSAVMKMQHWVCCVVERERVEQDSKTGDFYVFYFQLLPTLTSSG